MVTNQPPDAGIGTTPKSHRHRLWGWIVLGVVLASAAAFIAGRMILHRAGPILKGRVIETLRERFQSKVELDDFQVSIGHGIQASGKGLRIFAPDDVVAAGATSPLISIGSFDFHAPLMGLFVKPTHVGVVHVRGLAINIPPRETRLHGSQPAYRGKIKIEVDQIVCDDSRLVIGTAKPDKEPRLFELKHIVLHDVGPNAPWPYDATLTNAVPTGDIHAVGTFGPWNTESPGDSSVTGKYTFDHADLNTIKGLGGILSSVGEFKGRLDRIEVQGTAEVPDFSLDTANHPMPLHTTFSAVVDGTSGDTYLQPVEAQLAGSRFTCTGSVVNQKGVGHAIDLDINIPAGRIQDFLTLAVKTQPPVITGVIGTRDKLLIRPGKESVTQKMRMQGTFTLNHIHFTNPQVEDKVDMLSLRAQGDPKDAKPGAPDVTSRITGGFVMNHGEFTFDRLDYTLPGAAVQLAGVYSMDGKKFDFHGTVRTQATLSQMVASPWKSWMLKAVDPFFHKHGAGAEIPIKISGTNSAPKFGLDLGRKDEKGATR
jgi:hypothetical protein